jgi:hypothetical protein
MHVCNAHICCLYFVTSKPGILHIVHVRATKMRPKHKELDHGYEDFQNSLMHMKEVLVSMRIQVCIVIYVYLQETLVLP